MFNLRVYGILINKQQQVLVSDEYIRGMYITKFPGGGLEFGEGIQRAVEDIGVGICHFQCLRSFYDQVIQEICFIFI